MVGPTRNKLREGASEPAPASRAPVQPRRRRRRPTGAGEPEMEAEPQEAAEKPALPSPVGGGSLPGGARAYSPRRPRHLKAQNCLQIEVVAKELYLSRFQFLNCLLEQLRDRVHLLQRRQFSGRVTICVGERSRAGRALARGPQAPGRCPPACRGRP